MIQLSINIPLRPIDCIETPDRFHSQNGISTLQSSLLSKCLGRLWSQRQFLLYLKNRPWVQTFAIQCINIHWYFRICSCEIPWYSILCPVPICSNNQSLLANFDQTLRSSFHPPWSNFRKLQRRYSRNAPWKWVPKTFKSYQIIIISWLMSAD